MTDRWKEERELAEKRRQSIGGQDKEDPPTDAVRDEEDAEGRDTPPDDVVNKGKRDPKDPWMGGG